MDKIEKNWFLNVKLYTLTHDRGTLHTYVCVYLKEYYKYIIFL